MNAKKSILRGLVNGSDLMPRGHSGLSLRAYSVNAAGDLCAVWPERLVNGSSVNIS